MHAHDINGFYPLNLRHVEEFIPASPGAFALAVQLADGRHHSFYSEETQNLQGSLRRIALGDRADLPAFLEEYLDRFQCYLTYYVFQHAAPAEELEKMIFQTNDPILRLRVISSN